MNNKLFLQYFTLPGECIEFHGDLINNTLEKDEFYKYCKRRRLTPKRLTHFCRTERGVEYSPRWIIEYLFLDERSNLQQYSGQTPTDTYGHTHDALRIFRSLGFEIFENEEKLKKI